MIVDRSGTAKDGKARGRRNSVDRGLYWRDGMTRQLRIARMEHPGITARIKRTYLEARGIQPLCRKCRWQCVVLAGTKNMKTKFVCYTFERKGE